MAYQLPHWVWPVALLAVCGLSAWRGRDEERMAAGGLLAGWAISLLVFREASEDTQWSIIAIDATMFALYVVLSLRTRRYWPLFSAAFVLLTLLTHFAHALQQGVTGWAYWTMERVWSYLLLATIGYGAWTAPGRAASVLNDSGGSSDLTR